MQDAIWTPPPAICRQGLVSPRSASHGHAESAHDAFAAGMACVHTRKCNVVAVTRLVHASMRAGVSALHGQRPTSAKELFGAPLVLEPWPSHISAVPHVRARKSPAEDRPHEGHNQRTSPRCHNACWDWVRKAWELAEKGNSRLRLFTFRSCAVCWSVV